MSDKVNEIERLQRAIDYKKQDIDKYAQRDIATERALDSKLSRRIDIKIFLRDMISWKLNGRGWRST